MKPVKHRWYVAIGAPGDGFLRVGIRTTPNRAEMYQQRYQQQNKVLVGPFKTKRAAVYFTENPQIPATATVAEIEEAVERLRRSAISLAKDIR